MAIFLTIPEDEDYFRAMKPTLNYYTPDQKKEIKKT